MPALSSTSDHVLASRDERATSGSWAAVPSPGRAHADLLAVQRHHVGVGHERARLLDVHRVQAPPDQVVMLERHGALLFDHDPGARREASRSSPRTPPRWRSWPTGHDGHRGGQVDQDLLPHRAAVRILQVVHLVHDDALQAAQGVAALVQHVAQDLGGHHHDGGLAVDRVVAGQQPDALAAVGRHEVAVLLVRQRLERRGVEAFPPAVQRALDRELGHHRLAGAGRRGDQHRMTGVQRLDRVDLERIEREVIPLGERRWGGHPASLGTGFRV